MTRIAAITLALGAIALGASSALAVPTQVVFGSNNDGLGGFTQSSTDIFQESWSIQGDSIRYINDDPDGTPDNDSPGGTRNGSLLAPFALDRSIGKAYTVTGVVNLTDGYADDNNRVGIYLFGSEPDLGQLLPPDVSSGEDEVGALAVDFNMDDGSAGGAPGTNADDRVYIVQGIDNSPMFTSAPRNESATAYAQDLFGTTITLTATFSFRLAEAGEEQLDASGNNVVYTFVGGEEVIDVAASLIEADGTTTTTDTITILASDYVVEGEDDYFGFVSRARNRNVTPGRSAPWTMDFISFSIEEAVLSVPGDYNGDGVVDPSDYAFWSNQYAAVIGGGTADLAADGNGDGIVDPSDYAFWSNEYAAILAGGGAAAPEPATMALLGLGGLALLRRKK